MQVSRRIVIVAVIIALLLVAAIAFGIYQNQQAKLGTVEIRIAPTEASVRIDTDTAQPVKSGQTIQLREGARKLTFSRSRYENKELHVTITAQERQTIYVHLASNTKQSADESEEARKIKHTALSASYEKVLPVDQADYTIHLCRSLRYDDLYAICLYAATDSAKEQAVDLLKSYKIPVDESEIYFSSNHGYVVYTSGASRLLYYPSEHLEYPMMYFYAASSATAETDRQEMLDWLDSEGYDSTEFTIMYGDQLLMKYNATIEEDHDHAAAPQN